MIAIKKNKTIELSSKIFAGISLVTIMPVAIQAMRVSEKNPQIFQYSVNWFAVAVSLLLLWGGAIIYNFAVWIGYGRSDGKSWLGKADKNYDSYQKILLEIFAVWLFVGGLIFFIHIKSLSNVALLQESLVVFVLSFSLSFLGLKTTPYLLSENNDDLGKFHRLLENIANRNFLAPAFIILIIVIIGKSIHFGMFWQGMTGDQTLHIYMAQSLANGYGPYEKYVIMHPPFAYLPGAGAIILGRMLNLSDVISVRLFTVFIVILSSWLIYKAALEFTNHRSAAFFSAVLFVGHLVIYPALYVSQTKLVVVLFSLLMIRFIQMNKWFLTGFIIILLVLSWGGAFVYLPIPVLVLIFSKLPNKNKKLISLVAGVLLSIGIIFLYLEQTNTIDLFVKQYIGGLYQLIISKLGLGNPQIKDVSEQQITLFSRLTKIPYPDLPLFIFGAFAFLSYVISHISLKNFIRDVLLLLSDHKRVVVLGTSSVIMLLTLVDMQSVVDLIPLAPLFAILVGWLLGEVFPNNEDDEFSFTKTYRFIYIGILALGIQILSVVHPVQVYRDSLEEQKLVTDWLDQFMEEDDSIQIIGNLAPLVFDRKENLSRIIHLGPKTTIALQAENIELSDISEILLNKLPTFILVDPRNSEQEYLAEFFDLLELNSNYKRIVNENSRSRYAQVYYLGDVDIPLQFSIGASYAMDFKELFFAEIELYEDQYSVAEEYYINALKQDRSYLNYVLIQRAKLKLMQGKNDAALSLLDKAVIRGQYPEWGIFELARYYASIGDDLLYEEQLRIIYDDIPASFEYSIPYLFSLSEVLELSDLEYIVIDENHWIISHKMESINPDHTLLTLWWWLPGNRLENNESIIIEWVDEGGDVLMAPQKFTTTFHPQAGVNWSYLLVVPDSETELFLRIGVLSSDGEYIYSSAIKYNDD